MLPKAMDIFIICWYLDPRSSSKTHKLLVFQPWIIFIPHKLLDPNHHSPCDFIHRSRVYFTLHLTYFIFIDLIWCIGWISHVEVDLGLPHCYLGLRQHQVKIASIGVTTIHLGVEVILVSPLWLPIPLPSILDLPHKGNYKFGDKRSRLVLKMGKWSPMVMKI